MISEFLKKEAIFTNVNVEAGTKEAALKEISALNAEVSGVNADTLYKLFANREDLDSTGFGSEIAIPHAKVEGYKGGMIGITKFSSPIEWDSIDGEPVTTTINLIMPGDDAGNTHLTVISSLMRKLVHQDFIDGLKSLEDANDIYDYIIREMEEK